ncbi:glycosyltransferase family 2 protein [Streptomyces sp. NRRL F-5126]|uniref:glycosyltransferase family 2 protein n=1 Tax=Streptomyces sp. NRRL F-5126 TaxID=1463857 RepID=UPI00099BD2C2|nr:glycosyltransferase [Streptomyces sp. NRRL F-5126]
MPYRDVPPQLTARGRRAPGAGGAVAEETPAAPGPASIAVADLDLAGPDGPVLSCTPASGGPEPVPGGDAYALVRLGGVPVATVLTHIPRGADPAETLAAAYRAHRAAGTAGGVQAGSCDRAERTAQPPRTAVVVATRERAGRLARALDSLLAQEHPDFGVIVVDNAPATPTTRDLVTYAYADRVTYVREPVPGLAAAHNRGLAAVPSGTDVVAFTDDDVVADPHWLASLTAPFAADPRLGCTTGLILPARLTTRAQILLESHGGFAKGFTPRLYDPAAPPADEPLFPFTAGSFGSGANMAFRTEVLRAVGGFDPATGTGTAARGGDDLYGFVRVLSEGHRLRYTPDALVWHHHRETWQDLRSQAYGYGAGLTAYLTAVLVRRPALLPALLAKMPRGLAHARAITAHRPTAPGAGAGAGVADGRPAVPGAHGAQGHAWPRSLSRLERRGMVYGPLGYAKARFAQRGRRRT